MRSSFSFKSASRGITLVEQLVALSITATVVGSAVPAMKDMREGHRLNSMGGQLESDLQWARSNSVAQQRSIRVSFGPAGHACYVVHTGPASTCSCDAVTQTTSCSASGAELRSVHLGQDLGLTLSPSSRSVAFDANWGTVTPTLTVELRHRAERALRTVVNISGRMRTCSVGAAMMGHPSC